MTRPRASRDLSPVLPSPRSLVHNPATETASPAAKINIRMAVNTTTEVAEPTAVAVVKVPVVAHLRHQLPKMPLGYPQAPPAGGHVQ